MNRWDILMMALGMFSAATAQTTAAPVKIKILVYDYAKLASQPLSQSLEETAEVFRRAGIEPEWCVGTATIEQCLAEKRQSGGPVLRLNLLDETMAARVPRDAKEVGFAQREVAYVNVLRVQHMAQQGQFQAKVVLGHIIAHELGHVLLGPNAHSRKGLMSATLGKKELEEAHWGALRFSPEEAAKMRGKIRPRQD
jgi:hypothetical protein